MEQKTMLFKGISCAINAGKQILEIYNSVNDFEVIKKEDNSPLTIADQKSHQIITDSLSVMNIPILSEEGKNIPYEKRKQWDLFWLVDPLDGTKEFIKKNGEFTINIALISDNVPILGIIYTPVLDNLYFGTESTGAYKLSNAIQCVESSPNLTDIISHSKKLPIKPDKEPFTIVASRSHLSSETQEYINAIREKVKSIEFISKGSSLKFCMVAEGEAHVYPRFAKTMEWDTGAGDAIARLANSRTTLTDEKTPLPYNKKELTNPWFIVKQNSLNL